jgi:UDP-3-O-[3-hydroxymyristoyl] N-acetylglucosamine deacetylase
MKAVRLAGVGLHSGAPVVLTVRAADAPDAPLAFVHRAADGQVTRASLHELSVVRADHGVQVRLGNHLAAPCIDLVEHVLAAVGGLGFFRGVCFEVEGDELPLLDGGAGEVTAALQALSLPTSPLPGKIMAPFEATIDDAWFRIEPSDRSTVRATSSFPHPAIGTETVSFAFDAVDFVNRIAHARTFGFLRDHQALLASGRAHGAEPGAVLVFDDEAPLPASLPTSRDEPARHKMLDLLGDLTLLGGPFAGRLEASRPGHARTHRFLEAAFRAGALCSTAGPWGRP